MADPHYILFYDYVDDILERRGPTEMLISRGFAPARTTAGS
jgi:hypothetical protein